MLFKGFGFFYIQSFCISANSVRDRQIFVKNLANLLSSRLKQFGTRQFLRRLWFFYGFFTFSIQTVWFKVNKAQSTEGSCFSDSCTASLLTTAYDYVLQFLLYVTNSVNICIFVTGFRRITHRIPLQILANKISLKSNNDLEVPPFYLHYSLCHQNNSAIITICFFNKWISYPKYSCDRLKQDTILSDSTLRKAITLYIFTMYFFILPKIRFRY